MTDRLLVTGAQGFIGRYLIAHLLDRSSDVTVLGIGRSPRQDLRFLHSLNCRQQKVPAPLPEQLLTSNRTRYIYQSIDPSPGVLASIIREFSPTVVIHLAASLRGMNDEQILHNNVQSTTSLLEALKIGGIRIRIFLFASTGGVYGKQEDQPIKENASAGPLGSYSQSKLVCEDLVRDFGIRSDTPVSIARIFNVLGPGQDELHIAGRLASQTSAILAHGLPPNISIGSLESTRDFLDVRDVCAALSSIMDQCREGICNVGSGSEIKIADLLASFVQSAHLVDVARIEVDHARLESVPRHVADTKLLGATGFAPRYPIEVSCQEMLIYYERLVHPHCG